MTDDVADVDDLLDNCCQGFGVPEEDVYMVHLVPVKEGEPLSEDMACVVKSESFSIDYIEAILERNRRLEEKVARSAEALEVLASQVERSEETILQLEQRLSSNSPNQGQLQQEQPRDTVKTSRECSLQWQEVNSLLEDEIGRMRAQLIKSRSIRRENQETVDKLKRDLGAREDGILQSRTQPLELPSAETSTGTRNDSERPKETGFVRPSVGRLQLPGRNVG